MAQQTAVEWLIDQLIEQDRQLNPNSFTIQIYFEASKNIVEQAERIHEMQIKDAFIIGRTQGIKGMNNAHYSSLITEEDYYEQTYKTQAQ